MYYLGLSIPVSCKQAGTDSGYRHYWPVRLQARKVFACMQLSAARQHPPSVNADRHDAFARLLILVHTQILQQYDSMRSHA
jgi:hypothetical protein